MPVQTAPSLNTVETLVNEAEEWSGHVLKIRRKMRRLRPGSEAYLDLLSDLWVELNWLELKAKHAAQAIDRFEETLPDDEDEN